MSAPDHEAAGTDLRRFVLAEDSTLTTPRLVDEDVRHAVRVLRIEAGARLHGLDGRGAAWPLRVVAVGRRDLELALDGEPDREPEPGAEGARMPAVEVALSLPRGSRAEDCVGRLTQLGVLRITPLATERSPPHAREAGVARTERLARAGREAAKQCGRLWFPEIGEPESLAAWLSARRAVPIAWLDPAAPRSLLAWPALPRTRSLAVLVGPEGGFSPTEERLLGAEVADSRGVFRACLGGHVLRLETAAEAAVAVVMTRCLDG